ncbi:bifunctional 2-polyprenyl-6-hydroxyphenol methylase/3-demethylubiquinol 3-O-methyltransferase UbiG [Marinoscillum sp. MHG1-6]|uniref:class I SAM-dependent methyltransferase n=1 Tax=Marinoscillum sp. MHG1-6 TaxID=2959627 RepID=UPI0021575ED3|nr:class I SAM-dependent methyltransferase [Marinoscillum sp. MHG1-6]
MYYSYTRRGLIKYIPNKPKTALDVGCAEGNFGNALKEEFGCDVWGIEPVNEAAEKAKPKLDKVISDFFSRKLDLPIKHFDLVTFNDVLEHMIDPWDALDHTKNLLSEDGRVMASIPNFLYFYEFVPFMISQDWKYKSGGTFDKTHLRFFTRKSIIRLFEETGYVIEYMTGIGKVKSKKLWLLNLLTLGFCSDMYFNQFLVVAKPKLKHRENLSKFDSQGS